MSRLLKILSMEDLVVCMGGKNKYLHNHEVSALFARLSIIFIFLDFNLEVNILYRKLECNA